ncbi:apolipoprotein N-acyltransferase [Schlegelella sp. ID0723]|uniref:Apolipoprotein N-acyltransferase n=1 Tax=Piscinibacter koreensis TaxID=2742824 RepID=A0A7Y6TWU0_9BURK|nr:apolipoprotein N-acyltransferase [Schlegelella koreensis]
MQRSIPAWADALGVALVGALQTLCHVHTGAWPLHLAAIALLAWRVAVATPRRAALLGFAFGVAWLAAGTWWLFVSMHRYGGLPAPLAIAAVAALSAALSLYLAAAMGLHARWRAGPAWRRSLLFAALWLLAELARGVVFTGFPWVASGYAYVDAPLAGLAPWLGVYGIGFAAAALAAFIAEHLVAPGQVGRAGVAPRDLGAGGAAGAAAPPAAVADPRARAAAASRPAPLRARVLPPVVAGVGVLALGVVAGLPTFSAPSGRLSVSLLQGNVPQEEKFAQEHVGNALAWTARALHAARGELVVGPETVIPLLPQQLEPAFWDELFAPFRSGTRAALLGAPMGSEAEGYTNSALGVSMASARQPGGVYRYDKHHLVPFGEFIPTGFKWFTRLMNIPLGDFNRGPLGAPAFAVGAERVAPNICYEDLFGEELAVHFVEGREAPTILANLSNIGWFGRTVAVEQHLQISRMRTLELERPMLRATNTGTTAVIDHRGVVTARLEPFTQGVLDASVEGRTGTTPFAWWAGRLDLWPLWLVGAALALLLRGRSSR